MKMVINMKKIIFLLVQIAFMANVYSQDFLKEGLTWNNTWGDNYSSNSNFTYKVFGDTILGSKTYKIIKENYPDRDTIWNDRIYAREDSSRWFFIVIGSLMGDKLYYDFNLEVGDFANEGANSKVESIDSVTLENGERRKRIHFINDRDIWIEGIGSVLYHLDKPLLNFACLAFPCMNICTKQNDTLLYTLYPNLNCYDTGGIFMNLVDVSKDNIVSLYPNPAKSEVNISSESIINSIEIYNPLGQKVYQTKLNTKLKSIDINSLSKGIYIIGVNTDKGYVKKKFIKN